MDTTFSSSLKNDIEAELSIKTAITGFVFSITVFWTVGFINTNSNRNTLSVLNEDKNIFLERVSFDV